MKIKTITDRLDNAENFDKKVNAALADGWIIVKRVVMQPPSQPSTGGVCFNTMLYAGLEKAETKSEDTTIREERDLLEARLRHLLESETIRMFDEKDPRTHAYKRDISRLDSFNLPEILREYESRLNKK